jgi:hypothetical protein
MVSLPTVLVAAGLSEERLTLSLLHPARTKMEANKIA